jgi:hypothetical protein
MGRDMGRILWAGLPFLLAVEVAPLPSHAAAAVREEPGSLYDFLVMNVCTDKAGNLTSENPLHCPIERQRDLRPGEAVPYFHADFTPAKDHSPCDREGTARRYGFPLGLNGSDQTGSAYPIIVGWADYPISDKDCTIGVADRRDTITLLTIQQGFGAILGSRVGEKYYVAVGDGYVDPTKTGTARFNKTWGFPEEVPATGGMGSAVLMKHTQGLGKELADLHSFADHNPKVRLARTIEWWKRMPFDYGPAGAPVARLDSIVELGFSKSNAPGDAPGESIGGEHLYLTREFGYVTRWENWQRDDNKGSIDRARKAYDAGTCSAPADIHGTISPHFTIEPVVDDKNDHNYSQTYTITDPDTGTKSTHVWYMVGCHDFTNVHAQPPFVPTAAVTPASFDSGFLDLFKAGSPVRP